MSAYNGWVELPKAQQAIRGFHVSTREGSRFIVRFDPKYKDPDVDEIFGELTVIGRSQTVEAELHMKGIGTLPEVGSKIAVSELPEHVYAVNGETVKRFPSETISQVVEFQVPK